MQQYADIYLLLNYSKCFERPSRPSSGVHRTVVTASGPDRTICGASFLKRGHVHIQASSILTTWSRLKKLVPQIV